MYRTPLIDHHSVAVVIRVSLLGAFVVNFSALLLLYCSCHYHHHNNNNRCFWLFWTVYAVKNKNQATGNYVL